MKTKRSFVLAGAVLLCMLMLQLPDFASGGPLFWRLLHRRPTPPPMFDVPMQFSPLRIGGHQPVPVLNIAHRGACAFAPENTLESFRKAIELGCDMLELDVHVSKDGELIVVHDDDLLRCSNVKTRFKGRETYFVSDFTAAEIAQLDAGSWFVKELKKSADERDRSLRELTKAEEKEYISADELKRYASGNVKHPTLRQVLDLAKDKRVFVNIEPKTLPRQYPGLTANIVKLVEELKMEHQVIISSFDHDALVEVRQLSNIIATAALCSDRLHNPGRYVREFLDADAYNPGNYVDYDVFGFGSFNKQFTPGSMKSALDAKVRVNVWTVNDRDQMRQLIKTGATGLITDYPNRVREVLAELGKAKR